MAYVNYIKLLNEVANVYGAYSKTFITLSEIIDKCVSADVEEVKRGEWIKKPFVSDLLRRTVKSEFIYTCSVCGYDSISESNYCRKCGAKMDGERRDT